MVYNLLTVAAVSLGALTQLRQLGGVIGIAVTQAILNNDFRSKLANHLTTAELSAVLLSTSNIRNLDPVNRDLTRVAYGQSSNLQMRVVMAFAGAAILTSLFAWQKAPLDRAAVEAERIAIRAGQSSVTRNTSTASKSSVRSRIVANGLSGIDNGPSIVRRPAVRHVRKSLLAHQIPDSSLFSAS